MLGHGHAQTFTLYKCGVAMLKTWNWSELLFNSVSLSLPKFIHPPIQPVDIFNTGEMALLEAVEFCLS